jgi:hypothetical protein
MPSAKTSGLRASAVMAPSTRSVLPSAAQASETLIKPPSAIFRSVCARRSRTTIAESGFVRYAARPSPGEKNEVSAVHLGYDVRRAFHVEQRGHACRSRSGLEGSKAAAWAPPWQAAIGRPTPSSETTRQSGGRSARNTPRRPWPAEP